MEILLKMLEALILLMTNPNAVPGLALLAVIIMAMNWPGGKQ